MVLKILMATRNFISNRPKDLSPATALKAFSLDT